MTNDLVITALCEGRANVKKAILLFALGVAACSPEPENDADAEMILEERAYDAPGFVDFLAVDGETVWTTNRGRVEQWSLDGIKADVVIPGPCGTMAVLEASLWVANCKDLNLYRVDTQTATVSAIIETGIAEPRGETNVVAGAGSIWVPSDAAGIISRIDPSSNEVIAEVEVVPGTFFLAFGFDSLWAVSSEKQLLQRIDPATNSVSGTVELGNQPGFLVAGEGAVWVQEQKDGTVARILPETLAVSGRTKIGESLLYGDIDVGGGKVWLRTTEEQVFVTLDAENGAILERYGDPAGSGAIRFTKTGVWTSAHDIERMSWWSNSAEKTD